MARGVDGVGGGCRRSRGDLGRAVGCRGVYRGGVVVAALGQWLFTIAALVADVADGQGVVWGGRPDVAGWAPFLG